MWWKKWFSELKVLKNITGIHYPVQKIYYCHNNKLQIIIVQIVHYASEGEMLNNNKNKN